MICCFTLSHNEVGEEVSLEELLTPRLLYNKQSDRIISSQRRFLIVSGATSSRESAAKRPSTPSAAKSEPLRPKEHGAYGILGVPLITALLIGGINTGALLIFVAAVAGFLANEPLLVLWGNRGNRAKQAHPHARRSALRRISVAIVCGSVALFLVDDVTRWFLAACLILASLGFSFAVGGKHRSLAGQLLGIIGLTLPSAAILTSAGIQWGEALEFWAAWVAASSAASVCVRVTIASIKPTTTAADIRMHDALLVVALGSFAAGVLYGHRFWWALLPMFVCAVALRIARPHPRHLKRIGWALIFANVLSATLIIALWNH